MQVYLQIICTAWRTQIKNSSGVLKEDDEVLNLDVRESVSRSFLLGIASSHTHYIGCLSVSVSVCLSVSTITQSWTHFYTLSTLWEGSRPTKFWYLECPLMEDIFLHWYRLSGSRYQYWCLCSYIWTLTVCISIERCLIVSNKFWYTWWPWDKW